MSAFEDDTICAIATGSARGGIGIIRVSGPKAPYISKQILGFEPRPRFAHSCNFLGVDGAVVDSGVAIFFKGPNSFTGEDTLELQGHGGRFILKEVLGTVLSLNARLARPGEFTERSFLNGKIDLLQAEAIADLIEAGTKQLARSATRTLQGEFSSRIRALQEQLTHTRVNVEATIDFSDEDISIISSPKLTRDLTNTLEDLGRVFEETRQGIILREGKQAVIIGKPNVGKSSLLNIKIQLKSSQLLLNCHPPDRIIVQAVTQKITQLHNHRAGSGYFFGSHQCRNGIKCIKQKMRVELVTQHFQLRLMGNSLCLSGPQLLLAILRRHQQ